ncbi:hypothetical protein CDL12_02957 [Handroanthus impetiginosus]|uniref:Uncharacterized protein n=1 Tax=Handroanthus impetiginosus TaxID=429701 RepID=A0A2G9I3I3_9LAMI|nr:hypothetical protein CDL12_02957 [Handroanthus impetiginosus]
MAEDYATFAIIPERCCRRYRCRCFGFQTIEFKSNLLSCREIGRGTELSIRKNSPVTDDKHEQPSSSPAIENPNILPSSSFHLSTQHSSLDACPPITTDELEFTRIQLVFRLTKAPLKFITPLFDLASHLDPTFINMNHPKEQEIQRKSFPFYSF